MDQNRLYRSSTDKVFGGVAAGFAEYLNIDPIIARIIFVVLALAGGGGVIIYIVLWIFVPENPQLIIKPDSTMEKENTTNANQNVPPKKPEQSHDTGKGSLIAGVILITLGALFLIDRFFPRIDFGDLWPVILIVGGILLLRNSFNKSNQ